MVYESEISWINGNIQTRRYPWLPDDDFLPDPYKTTIVENEDGSIKIIKPTKEIHIVGLSAKYTPRTVNAYFGGNESGVLNGRIQYGPLNSILYYKKMVEYNRNWLMEEPFDWLCVQRIPYDYWKIVRTYREEVIENLLVNDPEIKYELDGFYYAELLNEAFCDLENMLSQTESEMLYYAPDFASLIYGIICACPDAPDFDIAKAVVDAYTLRTGCPIYDYDYFAEIIHENRNAIMALSELPF